MSLSPEKESIAEKPCFNCKRLIELPKLRIHEAQCRRMTYKCDKCLELIQKCEQEAHDYEFHEIVSSHMPMPYEYRKLNVLLYVVTM